MKLLSLLLAFCFQISALAQTSKPARPLILSAGVSPQAYQQFLAQHSSMISLVDYLADLPTRTDEKVYALADRLEDPTDQLLAEIQKNYKEQTLSEEVLVFLRDLLDKVGAKTLTPAQRKNWQNLSCFNDSLLVPDAASECITEKTKLTTLQKLFPWAEGIKIESRFMRLQAQGQVAVMPMAAYHFQIFSNTHKTISFYGSLNQLKQQSFQPEAWVSGSCDEFTANVDDFSLHEQALTYFNDGCVQPIKNPEQKSTAKRWLSENKNWLYAGGAIALGVLAYGMRNKTLVIDSSGLQ